MLNKLYPPLKDPHVCYLSRTAFMAMLVFKNGSLCREKIRDAINESTSKTNWHCATDAAWAEFDRLLASSSAGNNGFIGIFFHEEEITPKATGLFRFDAGGKAKNHVRPHPYYPSHTSSPSPLSRPRQRDSSDLTQEV